MLLIWRTIFGMILESPLIISKGMDHICSTTISKVTDLDARDTILSINLLKLDKIVK